MTATQAPVLPSTLRLGAVELTVTDLERSIAFYEDALGLQVHSRSSDPGRAALGAGEEDLVVLHEDAAARPAGRHAGLFHFALLSGSREELARAVARLAARGVAITGASDHGVSEAIYLRDPDANGIELYADRPRAAWPAPDQAGARVGMFTIALDVDDLLATIAGEGDPPDRAAPGLVLGHVHLHVGDVERALAFYRDVLGFEEMARLGPAAAFVAAGGYHHHLGVNVWRGAGVPAAPAGAVGLRVWDVVLEHDDEVAAVRERVEAARVPVEDGDGGGFVARDPWDIAVRFRAGR